MRAVERVKRRRSPAVTAVVHPVRVEEVALVADDRVGGADATIDVVGGVEMELLLAMPTVQLPT